MQWGAHVWCLKAQTNLLYGRTVAKKVNFMSSSSRSQNIGGRESIAPTNHHPPTPLVVLHYDVSALWAFEAILNMEQ